MAKIEKKIALVTGASGGIGRAVAARLAKDGFSVILSYSGNPKKADEAVNEIKAAAGKAISVKADLSKADEVVNLFERGMSEFGQIDVVVHSAGIMPLSPIIKNDVKLFDEVIATNLTRFVSSPRSGSATRCRQRQDSGSFQQCHSQVNTYLRGVYRIEGRRRRTCQGSCRRTARSLYQRQRRSSGPGSDTALSERQDGRADRAAEQNRSFRAARRARGRCPHHLLPCRPGRRLDQRTGRSPPTAVLPRKGSFT